ncbi:MAG: PRC-barrel domain-containing protein [Desulfitobacteriia bacterium]
MLSSRKFLSLPIISVREGRQLGFVRNIVINPKTKTVAALIVDPRRFFKEQRIIPFNRVVNIGENAITINTESQVERAANLPDILQLIKEKVALIGIKVLTEKGKKIGVVDEFYINIPEGTISIIDISTRAFNLKVRLKAEEIITMGADVLIVAEDCEQRMEVISKGVRENVKTLFHQTQTKLSRKQPKN